MIRSILIGAVVGMRAMTPLAAVADAARRGRLPADNGAPALLGHPLVSAGTGLMAVGELVGDKTALAPARTVAPGIAGRLITGAIAGAALAPKRQRVAAALVGAASAVGSAYLTFALRQRAMHRFGQIPAGLVEDAVVLGGTYWLVYGAERARP